MRAGDWGVSGDLNGSQGQGPSQESELFKTSVNRVIGTVINQMWLFFVDDEAESVIGTVKLYALVCPLTVSKFW